MALLHSPTRTAALLRGAGGEVDEPRKLPRG